MTTFTGNRRPVKPPKHPPKEHTLPEIEVRYRCQVCGKACVALTVPGAKTPRYCLPENGEEQSECQKEGGKRRVQKHRAKAQGEGKPEVVTPPELVYNAPTQKTISEVEKKISVEKPKKKARPGDLSEEEKQRIAREAIAEILASRQKK